MRRAGARAALAAALVLGLAACDGSGGAPSTDGTGATVPVAERLTVATDLPNPPFAVAAPRGDTPRGFDIALVTEIARRAGVADLVFVDRPRQAIPAEVAAGTVDMSAAAWVITPARARSVAFGDPYLSADQAVLVRRGAPVTRLDDLAGLRVGVVGGSVGADLAATVPGARIVRHGSAAAAVAAVAGRRTDATIGTYPVVAFAARRRPGLVVAAQIPGTFDLGLMFPPDADGLREAFDAGLAAIKADGTYARIRDRWFAAPPGTAPPG